MAYKCLNQKTYQDRDGYQILSIRKEDIEKIRQWRNAQIHVLRQKVILTVEAQEQYFQHHIWPTFLNEKPAQILFSFLLDGQCIGYGGLTYLNWENFRSEISFLVDPIRAENPILYSQDFVHFLNLLCQVSFVDLQLHRLMTETYAFRDSTLAVLEKYGFKKEGVLREHVYQNGQWIDSIIHGLLEKNWRRSE